jgi:chromosome segregation ATPase
VRYRRHTAQSSFELFLDTICNTFGGILFIAILIAIQIRQTEDCIEPPNQNVSSEQIAELQQTFDNIVAEIDAAKILLETIRKTLPEPKNDEEKNLVNRYKELNDRKTKALTEKTEVINEYLAVNQQITASEEKIKEANSLLQQFEIEEESLEKSIQKLQNTKTSFEQNIAEKEGNINDLHQKIAQKEEKLKDDNPDKNIRDEKLSMPKLHDSDKKSTLGLMMHYNRLYEISNRNDFYFSGNEIGTPKPNCGIEINKTAQSKKNIQSILRLHNNKNIYITIIVYGDSADQFYLVRDCITAAGFEYALIPSPDDAVWTFGDGGGSRSVQ